VVAFEAMPPRTSTAETHREGDDERLLIEAAKADARRFGELYERNFDRVYAFLARRAASRGEADDLTAEVFHSALASLGGSEWRGAPVGAWPLQIGRNALADRWQRAGRERSAEPLLSREEGGGMEMDRRAVLSDLVSRLPADQQRVLLERFVEQKSIRGIAKEVQRTEGAVKQLHQQDHEPLRARISAVA